MTELLWFSAGFVAGVVACVIYGLFAMRALCRSVHYFSSEDSTNNKD